ncbi:precorrin-2 dehydrogenase/sirohydrochlorin ferrochelatase family protein [Neisseria sp. Ec49-e6-T10]|uniref:precorrin-2 dehydrogenase/sirohydrochlorin ferrochelatase family protein n=1 Tax=Neisseria sp. Ec49-e6-T10 TaxID=3140744 RepID=UPI003EC0FC8B
MLYPLMLKLNNKQVVVVGGGKVALRKVKGLLGTGAKIKAVSPEFLPEFYSLAEVELVNRVFEAQDVSEAHIVYAATNVPEVNRAVGNVIEHWQWFDDTSFAEASNFYTPAVVRQDGLILAISTGGEYPEKAKKLKQQLSEYLHRSNNDIID